MGAKVKATAKTGIKVEDPAGLLEWLGKDRAMARLGAGKAFDANKKALKALVKSWIVSLLASSV